MVVHKNTNMLLHFLLFLFNYFYIYFILFETKSKYTRHWKVQIGKIIDFGQVETTYLGQIVFKYFPISTRNNHRRVQICDREILHDEELFLNYNFCAFNFAMVGRTRKVWDQRQRHLKISDTISTTKSCETAQILKIAVVDLWMPN